MKVILAAVGLIVLMVLVFISVIFAAVKFSDSDPNAQQLPIILAVSAVILSAVTWFGSGVDLIRLFREWQQDTEKPVLKFGRIYSKEDHIPQINTSTTKQVSLFLFTVEKTKGEGMASGCECNLTIENTEIVSMPTVWTDNNLRSIKIGSVGELKLFEIDLNKTNVSFFRAKSEDKFDRVSVEYDKIKNKNLIIDLYITEKGKPTQQNFTKMFGSIIKEIEDRQTNVIVGQG